VRPKAAEKNRPEADRATEGSASPRSKNTVNEAQAETAGATMPTQEASSRGCAREEGKI